MEKIERLQHELHAKLPVFKRKVDRAKRNIEEALATIRRGYLAFSTGIDSTVLLHMLSEFDAFSSLDVLFGDEGFDYPDSLAFLCESAKRYEFRLHLIRDLNAWRKTCIELNELDLAENPDKAWGNPFSHWCYAWDSQHPELMPTLVYDGVFLGMLASESRARRITLHQGKRALYQVFNAEGRQIQAPDGRDYEWHSCPLAHFDKRDIWAYTVMHNLPYNPVYDRLAELGVPIEKRRVAALSYVGVAHFGSIAILKSGWPELYNKLCSTFPMACVYG